MPFERPTLATLIGRVKSDIRGRLSLVSPLVRRAMADVLATVWAGAVHMLHGHLEWLSRQLFADTAEREHLLRMAAMYGITPTPASFSTGTVEAAGTDGSAIDTGTILQRGDGVTYRVTADASIASGTATVSVQAVLAGSGGDLEEGESLTFESPIPGVNSTVEVTGDDGLSGGFDEESTEGVRDRLILRLREPPEGGADQDYRAWALAVAGVTRAWVYPHEDGLGTVTVRFMTDDPDTGEPGFPDGASVTAVQAALDAERPITAEVTAAAPTPLPVAFTIAVVPDTAAVKAAVEAELVDLLAREAEPGDGDGRGTILLSRIFVAVGIADGIEDFTITVPAADVVPEIGELPTKGTVTWA